MRRKHYPEVSYEDNENIRFIRRTLDDGSELVYIRNISAEDNTITVDVSEEYGNCYFLDQSNGKVYAAEKQEDGKITFTMDASNDRLSGMGGDGVNSMAIALLCEKGDAALDESAVSEGTPKCLGQTESADTREVTVIL